MSTQLNYIALIPDLVSSIFNTIFILSTSIAIGLCVALFCVYSLLYGSKTLKAGVNVYLSLFRGTPLLVQIFFIYYAIPQLSLVHDSFLWVLFKSPINCAIIALSLNTGAYSTAIFYGGALSIAKSQTDAALAMGMSPFQIFTRILWPQTFRATLPSYGNEVIILLKGSALVFTITVIDIMGLANLIRAKSFLTYEPLFLAGFLYLCLTYFIIKLFSFLERKFSIC